MDYLDAFNRTRQNRLWQNDPAVQPLADFVQAKIPATGKADDPVVEKARQAINLYYDMYNNGGGNACERWPWRDNRAPFKERFGVGPSRASAIRRDPALLERRTMDAMISVWNKFHAEPWKEAA